MKRLMAVVAALMISFCANAESEVVDGITWYYENFLYESKFSSRIISGKVKYTGNLTIPPLLGGLPVKGIASAAFSGCSGLTSVTVPPSVESISPGAFSGCSSLTNMVLPFVGSRRGGSEAFGYVFRPASEVGAYSKFVPASLRNVEITDDTVIAGNAFSYCSGLTSVSMSSDVASIGSRAFYMCSGLTSVTIPQTVTSIGEYAFYNCSGLMSVTLPPNVTGIGDYAFYNCCGLTSMSIPSSVMNVGRDAFYNCSGIISFSVDISNPAYSSMNGLLCTKDGSSLVRGVNGDVTIPSCVISVERGAFSGCSGLTSVKVPNSVTRIGEYAFSGCSGLTSVKVPNGVTRIGEDAFSCCTSLTNMVLPFIGACRGNTGTEKSLFGYLFGRTSAEGAVATMQRYSSNQYDIIPTYYIPKSLRTIEITDETVVGYGAFYNCSSLTSVTIPSSVTSIDACAFYKCSGLLSVTIPGGVKSIGASAFSGCCGLVSVTIPEGVTSISASAFYGCSALTALTIPNGVTTIEGYAFSNCSGLKSVVIPSSITSVGADSYYKDRYTAFSGCNSITDVVTPGWKCGIDFSSVTNLVIAEGTAGIADSAFSGCISLKSVTFPSSVSTVGSSAFSGCTGLTEIDIPSSVKNVKGDAFAGCANISRVNVPCMEGWIGIRFGNDKANPLHVGAALCIDEEEVVELVVPDGTTEIGDYAFQGGQFTSVTIPSSVAKIAVTAFEGCNNVVAVSMPTRFRMSTIFPLALHGD